MLFFDANNHVLYTRNDAEQAHWVQEEYTLQATFPYIAGKVVCIGQRIGFVDPAGNVFQAFEIRNVQNIEPDHYQQIRAEHVVVADLSDEHTDNLEITAKNPAEAVGSVLAVQTRWALGACYVWNVSSANISRGSVWDALNTIQANWNVRIVPRVVVNAQGLQNQYIDIYPRAGEFRGLRLAVYKNMADSTVTYDDTEVVTALYGYGGSVDVPQASGEDTREQLTLAGVSWQAEAGHPAKPLGQKYLEWPEKTAIYGRGGRPRFGYYQNSDITDGTILLQKTWEELQKSAAPRISITGTCADLHRLGYTDIPIRLNDLAIVEIRETGETFQLQVIRNDVDLLDPTATVPEIGAYIPNIVYIARRTEKEATTSRGGGGGGGRGQTNKDFQEAETFTAWEKADDKIGMIIGTTNGGYHIKAGEIALAINRSGESGQYESTALINADHINISGTSTAYTLAGDLYHDANGDLVIRNAGGLYVQKTEQGVTTKFGVWDANNLTGGIMVDKINGEGTTVKIHADHIELDGETTAQAIYGEDLDVGTITCTYLSAGEDGIRTGGDVLALGALKGHTLQVNGTAYTEKNFQHNTYTLSGTHYYLYNDVGQANPATGSTHGQIITNVSSTTIYYLGR